MIDTPAQSMVNRLSPVLCARCNRPVGHMNKMVPGAEAGGMCTRCEKGPPFTYYAIISVPCDRPCCQEKSP